MDADIFVEYLISHPDYEGQVVHVQHIPSIEADFGKLDASLNSDLQQRLTAGGIRSFYSHQAETINAVRRGRNIIIATGTASGKTLCYNVPVLDTLANDSASRALYLFPTKALAQDQLRNVNQLIHRSPGFADICATFDGDTPQTERPAIKKHARIVLTNPDMLHIGILPNHRTWATFLQKLKIVVVDEAHMYRGIFGSHVAHVLRRLRRLCHAYGGSPQFILCSATIANPGEHAENLVGLPFTVINKNGAPQGKRSFVFWNPPFTDAAKGFRRSPNSEAASLFTELVRHKIRTLAFARTRKLTELIYIYSREHLGPALAEKIKPYRAGYIAEDRRHIERELFSGHLLGVVATTALELGIDIGDLDATVLTGYPGSIASTFQQAGRSGRRNKASLSFLIGGNNPLDQYIMRNPDFLFSRGYENAMINIANPNILGPHLLCAAWEKPLTIEDSEFFGCSYDDMVQHLSTIGKLHNRLGKWYLSPSVTSPSQGVNIRSASDSDYVIIDAVHNYEVLETIESGIAFSQIHPGAVYLHQGEPFVITSLDIEKRVALASPSDLPFYTQSRELVDARIKKVHRQKEVNAVSVHFGDVEVTTEVVGFKRKKQFTDEVINEELLELPPQHFYTQGLWFDIPPWTIDAIAKEKLDFAGSLHAVEHAAIGMLPSFALCDRNDIGGMSTPLHPDTGKPQIFIYDAYPGGIGIAEHGYDVIQSLWEATMQVIQECPCEDGCPGCIQSPKCGNNNEPLDKKGAMLMLRVLLGLGRG
ncbi:MAG TPA: DEAD/DEAH box helicase [Dehalococcoidia bacterium]|nr:DEAD/DEAH box helicase [Dehalococcoidia bacterium]